MADELPPPPPPAELSVMMAGAAACCSYETTDPAESMACPDCELYRMRALPYGYWGSPQCPKKHEVANYPPFIPGKPDAYLPSFQERAAGYKELRRRFPDAPKPQVWHVLCMVAVHRAQRYQARPKPPVQEKPIRCFEFGGCTEDGGIIIRPAQTRHVMLPDPMETKESTNE